MTRYRATPTPHVSAPSPVPVDWNVLIPGSSEPIGSVRSQSWAPAKAEAQRLWPEHAETLVVVERGGRVA